MLKYYFLLLVLTIFRQILSRVTISNPQELSKLFKGIYYNYFQIILNLPIQISAKFHMVSSLLVAYITTLIIKKQIMHVVL